jgi:hypothetical protein
LFQCAAITIAGCAPATLPRPSPSDRVTLPIVVSQDERSTFIERSIPQSDAEPRRTIAAFFTALTHTSTTELARVLSADALSFQPNHEPGSAVVGWQRRLSTLDYSQSPWAQLLKVQVFDRTSAQQLDKLRHFRLLPANDEWLAVVDLPKTQVPPIWGSQMQFILRSHDKELQITKIWEDFAL